MIVKWIGRGALTLLLMMGVGRAAVVDEESLSETLFEQYKDAVYRIDTINVGADKKSSLGTGFVVADPHLLATNFHVVSSAVHEPEQYHLQYRRSDGKRGALRVIAVDVVHDLALLRSEEALGTPFSFGKLTRKGTPVFSLGHPLALDLSIVAGTANGVQEKALYEKILFSGNINPGMSGGPAINSKGQLIGINVATSGNGVGYLVPAPYLQALIAHTPISPKGDEKTDLQQMIGLQLLQNQQALMDEILHQKWPQQGIGKFSVPAEISSKFDCWGETEPSQEKRPYTQIGTNCTGQDDIFLSERQRAGSIAYQYFWLETGQLNSRAFYNLYQSQHNSEFQSDAREQDVGSFACSVRFVRVAKQNFKANICARPYRRYNGLQDVMVLMAMTGHAQQGFMFTLDMSAVTMDNALQLLQRFLEHFQWQA